MVKLYMVLLVNGVIVGGVGPLSGITLDVCQGYARMQELDWDRKFAGLTWVDMGPGDGPGVLYRSQFRADCMMLNQHPGAKP